MAQVLATDVVNALATKFAPRTVRQTNQACVLAQLLPVKPHTTGKQVSWDIEIADGTARNATDGQDVSTYNADLLVPAALPFCNYDDAIKINGDAIDIARATNNPEDLFDLVDRGLENSVRRIARTISPLLYTGAAGAGGIVGMKAAGGTTGAFGTTGTYAAVVRGTYPTFVGNLSGNGAVLRDLTLDLLQTWLDSIAVASGKYPDFMVWGYALARKYAAMIQPDRRWNQDVVVGSRKVTLDAGWNALSYNNIPIIRDIDCPANSIFGINAGSTYIKQLTSRQDPAVMSAMKAMHGTAEHQLGEGNIPLTIKVHSLAKTGDSEKLQAILKLALVCDRPNENGVLYDVE